MSVAVGVAPTKIKRPPDPQRRKLTIAAFLSMSRLAVRVVFDDDGYAVRSVDAEHSGKWLDVTKLTVSEEDDGYALLEKAGRKRGFLISGGEVDTERMSRILLDEFRGGKLGHFTLELPPEGESA